MGKLFRGFGKAFRKWHDNLPGAKQHLDAVVALLTILLTITVLLLNFKNLEGNKQTPTQAPGQTKIIIATQAPGQGSGGVVTSNPSPSECQKGIAPIQITSPQQGDIITSNPVCIAISYNQGDYCSAVWSYRINGGLWSDYGNDSPCLYNPPSGAVSFDLRVKSLVTNDTEVLNRTFTYQSQPTPTTASSSATH